MTKGKNQVYYAFNTVGSLLFAVVFIVTAVVTTAPNFSSVILLLLWLVWFAYAVWSIFLFARMARRKISIFQIFLYTSFMWIFISVCIWVVMITSVLYLGDGNLLLTAFVMIYSIIGVNIFGTIKLVNWRIRKIEEGRGAAKVEKQGKTSTFLTIFFGALIPVSGVLGMTFARWFFGTGIVPDDVIQGPIFAGAVVGILTLIFFFMGFSGLYTAYLIWKFKLYAE